MFDSTNRLLLTLIILVLVIIAATQLPPLIDRLNERLIDAATKTEHVKVRL